MAGLKFAKELPKSDGRPHDELMEQLAKRPGEWALVLEAENSKQAEHRARVLRRKGAKCSIRKVNGTPQVWAQVER